MRIIPIALSFFCILSFSQVDYAQDISSPNKMLVVGIVNGRATRLPKPKLSKEITAACISDQVKVEVSISVEGKVLAAKAVSGHQIFWPSAERAARRARFNPVAIPPIKIKGYLVYNFPLPKSCVPRQ